MAKKRDLLTRARDLPSLCDPECEGRCWECPQTVIDELIAALDAPPVGEPAPMPPEMPEIQVGDWYLAHGRVERPKFPWSVIIENRRLVHSNIMLVDIDEIRGERNGVPFVWRRADRKEPA